MISLDEYFQGRDKKYPPTDEMHDEAANLLDKISMLEDELGVEFIMTGGYRPEAMIEDHEVPGCPHDAHSTCQGIDIHDPDLEYSKALVNDPELLVDYGLYMESPDSAKNHLHLQSRPPKSLKRIFFA